MSVPARSVALVTGASSGIGRVLAGRLAEDGFDLCLGARRGEHLARAAEEIRVTGARVVPVVCDVSDRDAVVSMVDRCRAELGPVDLLIANAGVGGSRHRLPDAADVERVLSVNFMGAVHAVEAVLPDMLERGSGHLVCVSSLAGYQGLPTAGAYSASKAALTTWFESLRVDLRHAGVSVTVLAPGWVRTAMTEGRVRPFMLELDPAVDRMMRAIRARRPHLAFPAAPATAVRLARLLPRGLYDRIARRVLGGGAAFTDPP